MPIFNVRENQTLSPYILSHTELTALPYR